MRDLEITGAGGFYQLQAGSTRGRRFLRRVEGYGTFAPGVAYCDDTRLTQAIADGAVGAGLAVEVNGTAYTGDPNA
jgi:hypothetical protein